jgi:hypothetical protein
LTFYLGILTTYCLGEQQESSLAFFSEEQQESAYLDNFFGFLTYYFCFKTFSDEQHESTFFFLGGVQQESFLIFSEEQHESAFLTNFLGFLTLDYGSQQESSSFTFLGAAD